MYLKRAFIPIIILLFSFSIFAQEKAGVEFDKIKVRLVLPEEYNNSINYIADLFERKVMSRCNAVVTTSGTSALTVELGIEPGIGAEGFKIEDGENGCIGIIGGDERGILYGVGKFLRTSQYNQSEFIPGRWRGVSIPVCPVRGIYMATHFMNFYEAAPHKEVIKYLEDLSLWGLNTLIVHFPTWQFSDFNDPKAIDWLENIKLLFCSAKKAGLRIGLIQVPNQGFNSTPNSLRGVKVSGNMRGNFGVNLCPSNKEAHKLLIQLYSQLLDEFKDIGMDYFIYWPYDEGGCACEQCSPWGARGFVKISKAIVPIIRKDFPECKIVLSTWSFENEDDNNPEGEWVGLTKALEKDRRWVDYIMADGHGYYFPKYPLEKGVPGGLPLLTFPEISMWGKYPWGGFGATPLPEHFQTLWNRIKGRVAGGTPYSEGIYEDINKVIYSQFFWNPEKTTEETVREYIAFEYSPDVVDEVMSVIRILEANHKKRNPETAEKAFEIVRNVNVKLPTRVQSAWRWRLLYLRILIDRELCRENDESKIKSLKMAFDELEHIYYTNSSTLRRVRPPDIKEYINSQQ